ncbi:hypothetical protein WJX72_003533 [[Myrmecia] bisecta]|uniref:Uncharacterized protein n=1 Tax=[Myrmecia] bisecta TaxID=41462 RepID=A0AAW1QEM9_9CHLO
MCSSTASSFSGCNPKAKSSVVASPRLSGWPSSTGFALRALAADDQAPAGGFHFSNQLYIALRLVQPPKFTVGYDVPPPFLIIVPETGKNLAKLNEPPTEDQLQLLIVEVAVGAVATIEPAASGLCDPPAPKPLTYLQAKLSVSRKDLLATVCTTGSGGAWQLYGLASDAPSDEEIAEAASAMEEDVSPCEIQRLRALVRTRGALLDVFIDFSGGGDAFTLADRQLTGNLLLGLRLAARGILGCSVKEMRELLAKLPGSYEYLFTCCAVLDPSGDASGPRVADAEATGIVYPEREDRQCGGWGSPALHLTLPVYFLLAIQRASSSKLTAFQLLYHLRALALRGRAVARLRDFFGGAWSGAPFRIANLVEAQVRVPAQSCCVGIHGRALLQSGDGS